MEASPEPQPTKPGRVFLNPEIVEAHLQSGEPVDEEMARMIWLMNHYSGAEISPETTEGGW